MPKAWGKSQRRLNRHRYMQGMYPPKQPRTYKKLPDTLAILGTADSNTDCGVRI